MTRAEKRRRDFLAAQTEKINLNGMPQESSPASTRTAAEVSRTAAQPDTAPVSSDHAPSAVVGVVHYHTSVRDRLAIKEATKPAQKPATPQDADAAAWLKWNEAYRAKYGHYPSHGI